MLKCSLSNQFINTLIVQSWTVIIVVVVALQQPLSPTIRYSDIKDMKIGDQEVLSSPSTADTERPHQGDTHSSYKSKYFTTQQQENDDAPYFSSSSIQFRGRSVDDNGHIGSPLGIPLLGVSSLGLDDTSTSPQHRRQRRPWFSEGSVKSSIFNLTNATLGAGIVSVPFAMMSLGLGLGLLTILLLAIASTTATKALVTVLDYTSASSFESLANLAGGRNFSLFVQLILLLFNFGSAIGYLICIGDVFSVIIHAYHVEAIIPHYLQWILARHFFVSIVTVILLLPLCLVDKLSKLRMTSLLGLVALELLVIVTFVLVFQKGVHPSLGSFPYTKSFVPSSPKGPLRGVPLLVFAFSCHSNAPSIYNELENQSYRRMAKVSRRSAITALITYLVMGVSGFAIYGQSLVPNVLFNFTSDLKHSVLLLIAFIGILIGVILSFPMNIFPCRTSVEHALFPDATITPAQSVGISVGLVLASLCIGLKIPSLAILFSFTGSTCGAFVAFIGPGLFVLLLLPSPLTDSRKIKALVLFIVGVFIAIFGTAVTIAEMIHPP